MTPQAMVAVLVTMIIFVLSSTILYFCRRKRVWLAMLVMATYGGGVAYPAVLGMQAFADAMHQYKYRSTADLFIMAFVLWVFMLIALLGGIWWIWQAINKTPDRHPVRKHPDADDASLDFNAN